MGRLAALWVTVLITASLIRCADEEETPEPRTRPEHPEDGTPPFDDSPSVNELVQQAQEEIGSFFDVYVHAERDGEQGCSIIQVEDIVFTPSEQEEEVLFSAAARWASYPPSFQPSMAIDYRSGGFPLSDFTSEYPEYGMISLQYYVSGTYDLDTGRMSLLLQNVDTETGEPSDIFLTPVYESWTDEEGEEMTCIADEDTTNETFVAVPAQEVGIPIVESGGEGSLCRPCGAGIDEVSLEVLLDR